MNLTSQVDLSLNRVDTVSPSAVDYVSTLFKLKSTYIHTYIINILLSVDMLTDFSCVIYHLIP